VVGAAGIPIYPGGGRLGACAFPHVLGMEKSKKIAADLPEDNFWNSP